MKAIVSVAVVAAMLSGVGSLQAATKQKVTKKTSKKATKAKKVLRTKAKKVAVSPWSFGALVENEYKGSNVETGGALDTGTTYFYLRANYKLNSKTSFRVQQAFTQAYENSERTQAAVGYTYLQIAQTDVYRLGSQKFNYYARAYLPTDIAAREENNQYLELRGDLSTKIIDVKSFSMNLHLQGRYYAAEQFQDATQAPITVSGTTVQNLGDIAGRGDVNKDVRIRPYFATSWDLASKINYYQQLGYERTWMKDGSGGDSQLYAYGEVGYQVTNAVGIQLGAYASRPMEEAFAALYRPSDSLYYLNGSVSF